MLYMYISHYWRKAVIFIALLKTSEKAFIRPFERTYILLLDDWFKPNICLFNNIAYYFREKS
jgi:hypothetical protein